MSRKNSPRFQGEAVRQSRSCGLAFKNARGSDIRLRPQIRLADALKDKPGGVDAHIVHIDLDGSDRRVRKHGKGIIIKGQQRHILRNFQAQTADML